MTTFREVVVVEYPRKDVYCFAFLTNDANFLRGKGELISIFLPTTPNPTSGFFLLLPIDQVYKVDISVEEAFKLIMSAGLLTPDDLCQLEPYSTAEDMEESEPMEESEQ